MGTQADEKRFKQFLKQCSDLTERCITTVRSKWFGLQADSIQPVSDQSIDPLLVNIKINPQINDLIIDDEIRILLDEFQSALEDLVNKCLQHLSSVSSNFLLDFLRPYHYDFEKKQFRKMISINQLYSLIRDIKAFDDSIDGFAAAFQGDLPRVKQFLKEHADWKNRSGLWQTTMLYSAARNDQLDTVNYLITEAKCSINAQNRRNNSEKNLSKDIYTVAGSTALHGACFHQHLQVVQYLIEHGADYLIRNESDQTVTMIAEQCPPIKDYFKTFLILYYSVTTKNSLPTRSIPNEDLLATPDGWWEYKPIKDPQWYRFSKPVAKQLTEILAQRDRFEQDVLIKVDQSHIYNLSMINFFRSGNYQQDVENQVAWIRFRGSSIANFDCFARWQLMLSTHTTANHARQADPSLEIESLSDKVDRRFRIRLNLWYNCDETTNALFDETINRRQKTRSMNIRLIGDEIVVNFEKFTFESKANGITGHLRWIPKLISNVDRKKHQLVEVDNYEDLIDIDPIPFTRAHLKALQDTTTTQDEPHNHCDSDSDESDDEATIVSEICTIADLNTKPNAVEAAPPPTDGKDETVHSDAFFYKGVGELMSNQPTAHPNPSGIADFLGSIRKPLLVKHDKIAADIEKRRLDVEACIARAESNEKAQRELQEAINRIEQLQKQLKKAEEHQKRLNNLLQKVTALEYRNIDEFLIKNFVHFYLEEIINYVASKVPVDEQLEGRLPKIIIKYQATQIFIKVTGLPEHHNEYKVVQKRLEILSNNTKSGQTYCQRLLDRINRQTQRLFREKIFRTSDCQCYIGHFQKLLKEKMTNYRQSFDEYILKEAKGMTENTLNDTSFEPWKKLDDKTSEYMAANPFMNEFDQLKCEALEGFIQEKVFNQQIKTENKPTAYSLITLNEFIEKVKIDLRDNKIYKGNDRQQWQHLPKLLRRIMLYYRCFLLQLPLYESSKHLLSTIEKSTVLTISTTTGSGKSTLLPALLVAEGYDKVLVTQPRRLPCTLICKRVNQTMTVAKDRQPLAGWAISGEESHMEAPILYLTDGLLKESLLRDQQYIRRLVQGNRRLVLFIDEVHERSVNIDLCLALIARILENERDLHRQIRVIISSATLDQSVPNLFRNILVGKFNEFKGSMMGILHPVKKISRPNVNPIDIVLELCEKRERLDQILCFVSSTALVTQYCSLLKQISNGTLFAFPLVQSQRGDEQQRMIEQGTIFFSTTVAETSLTFPSLTYVIDTGYINVPYYDQTLKRTILKEVQASESTVKQRFGRLGRTKPGEYYALYDFNPTKTRSHTAQICQLKLTDVEFSLRRSVLRQGLKSLQKFLPDQPDAVAIDAAVKELQEMNIIHSSNRLTTVGKQISELPDFGSVALGKCVLAALTQHNCGGDLIALASFLSVSNVSLKLSKLPQASGQSDGDFMILIKVMRAVLAERESHGTGLNKIKQICENLGLTSIEYLVRRAVRRYDKLMESIDQLNQYDSKAKGHSDDWKPIALSLLSGYENQIFVSMKDLYGRSHRYVRYQSTTQDYAVLDHKSVLYPKNKKTTVPIVLARDIQYSTSIRDRATISFLGRLELDWITSPVSRTVPVNTNEIQKCNTDGIFNQVQQAYSQIKITTNANNHIVLQGPFNCVYAAERMILQGLVKNNKLKFENQYSSPQVEGYQRMKQNLELVSTMRRIFNPMKWRWENEAQAKLTVSLSDTAASEKTCQVSIDARDDVYRVIKDEFESFTGWLKTSAVVRRPDQMVNLRVLNPAMRKSCADIEKRIAAITDSKRTPADLWKSLKGSTATRETRMDVVAWIVVCRYDCAIEGGFVRDRIVGNYQNHPAGNPSNWICQRQVHGMIIKDIVDQVVPKDLDCQLPVDAYFDLDSLLDDFHHYDISCTYYRDHWRYIFLFDENEPTGPFSMDLIEPHVALTHDRIDLDANNLVLKKDYTKELGMRVELKAKDREINLETIVTNIKNKRFQVLREIDGNMQTRIRKMESRGWTKIGSVINIIPCPPIDYPYVLVRLPDLSDMYKSIVQMMQSKIGASVIVCSIEEIKNPLQEEAYVAMRAIIARDSPGKNPNERNLFYGANGDAINGILKDGFDDRYRSAHGKWGCGIYFSDNPKIAHKYATKDPKTNTCTMFYNKVALGREHATNQPDEQLKTAPKDCHCVHGTSVTGEDEYVIYRYAQALPYLKIIYKA